MYEDIYSTSDHFTSLEDPETKYNEINSKNDSSADWYYNLWVSWQEQFNPDGDWKWGWYQIFWPFSHIQEDK